jgi:oligoendopeptidase F
LTGFKNLPSEVAELASMSMEMLTMNYWDAFYPNEYDFKRAKREQLEGILKILPWIAQIDAFQLWIYTNVNHSVAERHAYWQQLSKDFGTGLTDWSGFEDQIATSWQRQLHLFEVPFYYIEYGIAQLGALGVWKNSIINFEQAVIDYKEALKLGYTKSIPEIYSTANVKFDFSENYLKELADFIQVELRKM